MYFWPAEHSWHTRIYLWLEERDMSVRWNYALSIRDAWWGIVSGLSMHEATIQCYVRDPLKIHIGMYKYNSAWIVMSDCKTNLSHCSVAQLVKKFNCIWLYFAKSITFFRFKAIKYTFGNVFLNACRLNNNQEVCDDNLCTICRKIRQKIIKQCWSSSMKFRPCRCYRWGSHEKVWVRAEIFHAIFLSLWQTGDVCLNAKSHKLPQIWLMWLKKRKRIGLGSRVWSRLVWEAHLVKERSDMHG